MNPYELSLLLKSATTRLASLGLSPGPTPQQRAIKNISTAKSAARDLLAVPGLKELAERLLENDVAKQAVQDLFTYQDDGNLSHTIELSAIRSALLEAISILQRFNDYSITELPQNAISERESALLEIKVVGTPTFEDLVDRLDRTREIVNSAVNIAELGGLVERVSPLAVVAAGIGSVFIDIAAPTAGMIPVVKLLLWIAKQALQLHGQHIRHKSEIIKSETLGIGKELLKQQLEIHSKQTELYCQHLAGQIELKKSLTHEDQRRLEKSIRDTAGLISDGVRLLGVSSIEPIEQSKSLSDADYDQIENTAKAPLLLAPPKVPGEEPDNSAPPTKE